MDEREGHFLRRLTAETRWVAVCETRCNATRGLAMELHDSERDGTVRSSVIVSVLTLIKVQALTSLGHSTSR